jgi:hypothetical protein
MIKGNAMNDTSPSNSIQFPNLLTAISKILLGLILVAATASSALAQGEIPSGTVSGSGSGPYTYNITFTDGAGATSPIGSVWYGWVPGQFFLPSAPTTAFAPAGWTPNISSDSVQFVANSASFDIAAGSTLAGFGYTATFTPAQLAAAPNSGEAVAYSGALFSDNPGKTFTVTPAPEPSTLALLAVGAAVLGLAGRRKLGFRH